MGVLSERIKRAREEKGWELEELATRAGLKYHAVYSYERGREPKLFAAVRLARALGVTVETLTSGLENARAA